MRGSEYIVLGVIFFSFALGLFLYGGMPERMASHWNAAGEVDGYMPKFWALFFLPLILAGVLLMFMLIPKIDPLKKNIEAFRTYYDGMVVMVSFFLFYIYLLTLLWNLGFGFDMNLLLSPALAVLFYYLGVLMEYAKRNWFVGIRTPWTLSSDRVWEKTHKAGSRLFKVAGVLALVGLLFPDIALLFLVGPVLLISAYLIVYSYLEYQKEPQ